MKRVYSYGVRLHPESKDLVEAELRKAHRYHNELVAAHRRAWEAREKRRRQEPEQDAIATKLEAVEAEIKKVREEAKAERIRARKRAANPIAKARIAKLSEEKKLLKKEQAAMRERIKAANARAYEELTRRVDQGLAEIGKVGPVQRGEIKREVIPPMLEEQQWPSCWRDEQRIEFALNEELRRLRASADLLSGTYRAVEDAVADSVKDSRRQGKPPKFKRWDGTGRIGCQIKDTDVNRVQWSGWPDALRSSPKLGTKLGTEPVEPKSEHLRMETLPEDQWETRSGRRRAYSECALRVQSTHKGKPVWAYFSTVLHRPLPPTAQITWGYLRRSRVGQRFSDELQISLTFDRPARRSKGRVAVDVGWRQLRSGDVRAGYAVGDDGFEHEILVPAATIDNFRQAASLKSIGDRCFDQAKPVFWAWCKAHPDQLPDWFERFVKRERAADGTKPRLSREEWVPKFLASLPKWKSRAKLSSLIHDWSREILGGDEVVHRIWNQWRGSKPEDLWPSIEVAAELLQVPSDDVRALALWLDFWRRKNLHLYQWERDVEKRALRARREIFRITARRLADRYERVILEDFRLTPFCVKPKPENLVEEGDDEKRAKRVQTAPGMLRSIIEEAFCGSSERRPCSYTTIVCHSCLQPCEWNAAKHIEHTCEHCGAHWDQDFNAGRNLLNEDFFDRWHPEPEQESQAAE